jgi:hypothetical protein
MKFGTTESCASMFEAADEMAPATRPGARSSNQDLARYYGKIIGWLVPLPTRVIIRAAP